MIKSNKFLINSAKKLIFINWLSDFMKSLYLIYLFRVFLIIQGHGYLLIP